MRGRAIIVLFALAACGDDGSSAATDTDLTTSPTSTSSPCTTECPTSSSDSTGDPPTSESSSTASTTTPDESSSSSSTGEPVMGPLRLYVSGGGGISVWEVDDATGALTAIETVDLQTEVGPLAIDPYNLFLYAARTQQQSITAYLIDQTTGTLSEINTVSVGHLPVYLATDRTGAWLLTADFGADLIEIYPIGDAGGLGDTPSESRTTSSRPHSIFTDETNGFVFVP